MATSTTTASTTPTDAELTAVKVERYPSVVSKFDARDIMRGETPGEVGESSESDGAKRSLRS